MNLQNATGAGLAGAYLIIVASVALAAFVAGCGPSAPAGGPATLAASPTRAATPLVTPSAAPAATVSPASTANATATTTTSAGPAPLVVYHRSGGFAGVDDTLTIAPDRKATLVRKGRRGEFTVSQADFDELIARLERANFPALKSEYLPIAPAPDEFSYAITYRGKTVRTADSALPPELAPVIDQLNQIVQAEGAPRQ